MKIILLNKEVFTQRSMESYTLYLDATGDPGWPDPFGKSKIQWYVLAGLALSTENDLKAKLGAEELLGKYIPDNERRKWPDSHYEIHYHDLIFGHNIFSHLKHPQRKELADEIFDLIINCKPVLFATAINKLQHKHKYGERAYAPRILAMRATIHRFSMFLEREDFIGSVVVDTEEYKKDIGVRTLIHQLRRFGATIRGINYQPRRENKLKRILNAINLSPSEMSTGIQLADICSRSVWSHFEKQKSNRFDQLKVIFDRGENQIFEPSIIPLKRDWI